MNRLDLTRTAAARLPRPRVARADLVLGLGAASLVAAALFVFAGPGLREVRHANLERAVRGNAATLQLAAESYAAANGGCYPDDPRDLLPWLPGDHPPANPVSGDPVTFRPAPGGLTYRSPSGGRDYVIEGFGTGAARPLVVLTGHAPPTRAPGR